jgi:ATP-dependent Clp protease ATP-binding subunit ClpA
VRVNLQGLVLRLNPFCTHALEATSGLCITRSHYQLAVEHTTLGETIKQFDNPVEVSQEQAASAGSTSAAMSGGGGLALKQFTTDLTEKAHNVHVCNKVIATAVTLSARYLTGRQLPDKSVAALDTVSSRADISLTTRPAQLEDLERDTQIKQCEMSSLIREVDSGRSQYRSSCE